MKWNIQRSKKKTKQQRERNEPKNGPIIKPGKQAKI